MNKLKQILSVDISKLALESYPVVKSHNARWFFNLEMKTNPKINKSPDQLWNNLEPEQRRKFFAMAEIDEMRYKAQKRLWIAEFGSLLIKHGDQIEKLISSLSDQDKLQTEFLKLLETKTENYNRLIEFRSTCNLYKYVREKKAHVDLKQSTNEMLSAIPEDCRSILQHPKKPPPPAVLFHKENVNKITMLQTDERYKKMSVIQIVHLEWAQLSEDEQNVYKRKYQQLKDQYIEDKKEFERCNPNSTDFKDEANKEQRLFNKAIRKRLRDTGVVPRNVRNPFNFFVMEQKELILPNVIERWRNMSPENKAKYERMTEEDKERYRCEKESYELFMVELFKLFKKPRNLWPNTLAKNKTSA